MISAAICSPSRASLLTGRLPIRWTPLHFIRNGFEQKQIRNGFYQSTYRGRNAYTPQVGDSFSLKKSTRRLWEEYWMRRCWCLKSWLLQDTGKEGKPDSLELLLKESKTLYTGPSLLASGTWDIGRSFCPQGELLMYRRYNCVFNFF